MVNGVIWVRTTKFDGDGDGSGIPIIEEFYLGGVENLSFVCGGVVGGGVGVFVGLPILGGWWLGGWEGMLS